MGSTRKKLLLVIAAAFTFSTVLVGCGRDTVVKVNGRRISREEYYSRLEHLPYTDPTTGERMEAGNYVLLGLINEVLVVRLAEKKVVPPTEDQIREATADAERDPRFRPSMKELGFTEDQIREMVRVRQALFNLQTRGVKVTDKEVRDYYKKNKLTIFTTPEQAEAKIIIAKDRADADKAMAMLKKGMSFETVVGRISVETISASRGGYIPAISRNEENVPKPVRDMLFKMRPNNYSQPIPYSDGQYVIFKLLQRRKERTKKFEEVQYAIRQALMTEKGRRKNPNLEKELAEFKEKADINVSIVRYRDRLIPKALEQGKVETGAKAEKQGKKEAPKR